METMINVNNIHIDCPICTEVYNLKDKVPMVIDCGHTLCNLCLMSILSFNDLKRCPTCNKPLKYQFLNQYPVNYIFKSIINSYYEKNKPLNSYPNYKGMLMFIIIKITNSFYFIYFQYYI